MKEKLAEDFAHNYFVMQDSHYNGLKQGFLAGYEASQPKWKYVSEETPPKEVELLAKCPEGIIHICSWREGYRVFTCQCKKEDSSDWQWIQIPQ